jgi:hypothetical protein
LLRLILHNWNCTSIEHQLFSPPPASSTNHFPLSASEAELFLVSSHKFLPWLSLSSASSRLCYIGISGRIFFKAE